MWKSIARFIFMLVGTQGGKTSFGPHRLHCEITTISTWAFTPEGLGDFLAVTSTYDLFKLEMRLVFEHILQIDVILLAGS